jgi:CRISPR system Cascade subunit CasC
MKFLSIHIIQTLPYSNLNRDDVGSPKTMYFGGAPRARISSQALKRAARVGFEDESDADRTHRSKFTPQMVAEISETILTAAGHAVDDDLRKEILRHSRSEVTRLVKNSEEKDGDDGKKDTLTWLAEAEIKAAAEKVAGKISGLELGEYVAPATDSLTIAGFGRMFAAAPSLQTDAAVQVAHAFTTHAASTEVDYFTAVDDLRASFTGDQGSGHLDISEFTSGVFYRYLNVDRDQLLANWSGTGRADTRDRLRSWFAALLLNLPTGKQNSTAPHTLPNFIAVEECRQPLNFATTFENPVLAQNEGYALGSVQRFEEFAAKAHANYGQLFGERRTTSIVDGVSGDSNLQELIEFCVDWVLGE